VAFLLYLLPALVAVAAAPCRSRRDSSPSPWTSTSSTRSSKQHWQEINRKAEPGNHGSALRFTQVFSISFII
jgi:hypothetical protein